MKEYIDSLISGGHLVNVKGNSPLERKSGVITVVCGDCDRFPELFRYEKNLCREAGGHTRVHPIALNGGGLLVDPKSPLNADHNSSSTVLFHVKNSPAIKDIYEIAVYGHGPCSAAQLARLEPFEYFFWLARGAEFFKNYLKNANIACFFHFEADADTKFKTYFFKHTQWLSQHKSQTASA